MTDLAEHVGTAEGPTRAPGAGPEGVAGRRPARAGWLEERLGVRALGAKYGRKAFPVHASFFLGEMACPDARIDVKGSLMRGRWHASDGVGTRWLRPRRPSTPPAAGSCAPLRPGG